MNWMRLDKYLTMQGIGSRNQVKAFLKKGQVLVNGQVQKKPEVKIIPETDTIVFQGKTLRYEHFVYFILNKPAGCITATEDKKEKTVLDYITEERHRNLFPVGRLDKDTEGLLLITDDGELAHQLLSPKRHVDKVYLATLKRPAEEEDVEAFHQGLDIGEKSLTLPAKLELLPGNQAKVTVWEGKFHQVKRMFEARNNQVEKLKRLSMGGFILEDALLPGQFRPLTEKEQQYVKECKNSTV